jgi:hypothetical protein
MTDIQIRYIVLSTFLFLVLFISGTRMSRSTNELEYWKRSIFPIFVFSIISGLRFGRDIDYNLYYFTYTYLDNDEEMELVFKGMIYFFHYINFPYYLFVFVCSLFLISSLIYFLYPFRTAVLYVLPLFLGIMGIENLIRWYVAISFILIAIRTLMDSRILLSVIFAFFAIFSHFGVAALILVMLIFYIVFNRRTFPRLVIFCLFTLSFLYASTDILISLTSYIEFLPKFGISEKEKTYSKALLMIASGEMSTGIYELGGPITKVLIYLSYAIPIFFGIKLTPENTDNKNKIWIINLALISFVIMPIFSLVEIFNRFSAALMILSITFLGITIAKAKNDRMEMNFKYQLLLFSYLLACFLIIRIPFLKTKDNQMMYIWDSNGKNYLNY